MASKGRMQTGADADITIFDPATVTDNSKLEQGKNGQPSTGIPYVLVGGTVVVKDVFPGKPIRAAIVK